MNDRALSRRNRSGAPTVVVRGAASGDDLRQAANLMAEVYSEYHDAAQWFERGRANYPEFLPEHTRLAFAGVELSGALRINTETVRLGEARLKTGVVGYISVAPRFEASTVCRKLVHDALHYMRNHGYHVAMSFESVPATEQLGFATALIEPVVVVDTVEASGSHLPQCMVRRAKPGDIRIISRIHNTTDSDVSCSLIRNAAHITNKWDRWSEYLRVLVDTQGSIRAYCIMRRAADSITVDEVGLCPSVDRLAPPCRICSDLLGAVAEYAAEEIVGRIRFRIPPQHPFARYVQCHEALRETRVVCEQGGRMAFVNVAETLEHMIPEWEQRLSASSAKHMRTEVTLLISRPAGDTGKALGQPYRIRANYGAVDIAPVSARNKVSMSESELMRMMTGYEGAAELLEQKRCVLNASGRALFETIFPRRSPFVWPFDRL